MVIVVGWHPLDKGRLQWICRGASILASVRLAPSQVKALEAYVADCTPCFFLKVGYSARPSKKLRKALSRCLKACCKGTLDTSLSQADSSCFLRSVSMTAN